MGKLASCSEASSSLSQQRVPWLMLASEGERAATPGHRRFYSLESGTTRCFPVPDSADSIENRCLSSKGWLLTVTRKLSMSLVNPFSCVEITLPDGGDGSLDDFESFYDRPFPDRIVYAEKFALSSSPGDENNGVADSSYCVAIMYGDCGKIALWRSGDDAWTRVVKVVGGCPPGRRKDELTAFSDIIYYRGEFYAVRYDGWIFACGFDSDKQNVARARFVVDVSKFECFPKSVMKIYLVESGGRLLVVFQECEADEDEEDEEDALPPFAYTFLFHVLQLNEDEDGSFEVVEVKDLGDRALFLGDNESISLVAFGGSVCKANCIYFTDDWFDSWPSGQGAGTDMGIYNLKYGTVEPYYQVNDSSLNLLSPIWIDPRR